MKRGSLLVLTILLISLPIVLADAEEWLIAEAESKSSRLEPLDLSLVILATADDLKTSNKFLDALENQRDEDGCYPNDGCTVENTAAAIYAKRLRGKNVDEELEWLIDAQIDADTTGNWLLQIESSG
jgi:hypothetical protein